MESKMRVLYLWITSGDGNSYHRPLPCPKCSKWYMRLDNHMRDSHSKSYSASERADLLNVIREKEWGIENVCQAQKVTEIMKIQSADNFVRRHKPAQREGTFVPEEREYLPKNAILLTEVDCIRWGITEDDEMQIYYDSTDHLLEEFYNYQISNSSSQAQRSAIEETARSCVKKVQYIWKHCDPEMAMFPKNKLGGRFVFEDLCHSKEMDLLRQKKVAPGTIRARYSTMKAFLEFLTSRRIFAYIYTS